ncbi:hypothetical protein L6452_00151 [Arctium lappa]|uniref:Uncharacterized protein n=1 Tax=Arctium lappa TaxID=4217 RepID=A0ACB9FDX2_ARCLA|nr:hypothetical protein L6452_00151 [Arctium lappa]
MVQLYYGHSPDVGKKMMKQVLCEPSEGRMQAMAEFFNYRIDPPRPILTWRKEVDAICSMIILIAEQLQEVCCYYLKFGFAAAETVPHVPCCFDTDSLASVSQKLLSIP